MRKTSILLEVSDEVFTGIVEPFKKNKMLAKLVASLLNGYISDPNVRRFADGELDGMHKASVSAVGELFADMEDSLASLGIFTDELKYTTQSGQDIFSEQVRTTQSTIEENKELESIEYEKLHEEIGELRSQVKELKEFVTEVLSSGAVQTPSQGYSEEPVQVIEEPEIEEPEDDAPTEEQKAMAHNTMAALLSGLM